MVFRGIARPIVEKMVDHTLQLGQGRQAACWGFPDAQGIVSQMTSIVDGGLGGIPVRKLLSLLHPMKGKSLIEGISSLPEKIILIITRPGKTGLNTDVSGIDFFDMPIISIGVKKSGLAGVGVMYPVPDYFDLATESERVQIETLAAVSMEAEKEVLRKANHLELSYLNLCRELEVVDAQVCKPSFDAVKNMRLTRFRVQLLDKEMVDQLVEQSVRIGQGREVAVIGQVDSNGMVTAAGRVVVGGIGYVPSRLLASSAVDITGKSLRKVYWDLIPYNAVIVHTHPGGSGVMHAGDANAGPGAWARPIVAIGHDERGEVKGATVVEVEDRLFALADEEEDLNQQFFRADSQEEEAEIRNRKFGIAQEYTNLCRPIEIQL